MSVDGRTRRVTIGRIVLSPRSDGPPADGAPDPIASALADQLGPETASAVASQIRSRLSEGRR